MKICACTKNVQEMKSDPNTAIGLFRRLGMLAAKRGLFPLAFAAALLALPVIVEAATCTSVNSSRWNRSQTWSCNAVPTSADNVVIASGFAIDLRNGSANSLTIQNNGSLADNNGTYTLTISNNATINAGGQIDFSQNDSNLIVGGVFSNAGTVTAGAGTFTYNGNFTNTGTYTAGSSAMTVAGNFSNTGTFTSGSGTVTLNGSSAQTISGTSPVTFNNLTVTNGASPNITLATNVTVTGTLTGTVTLTSTCPTDYTLTSTTPAQVLHSCPPPPTVTAIAPNTGPTAGGTSVTITGTNFTGASAVTIGGVAATGITVVNATTITATTPAGTAGAKNVVVTTPGGSGTGTNLFTYAAVATVTASPTLCVSDSSNGGTYAWGGLTNVGAQDGVYASAGGYNSSVTEYLKCTGYGFSIPAGATINGITVGVWRYSRKTMIDQAMQLVKSGIVQSTNLATGTNFPGTNTETLYGGSTNLWGNTWTAADINSVTFGAAFAAKRGPYNSTDTAFVDYMPITVDYTLPAFPTVSSINLASTNPSNPATAVSWTVTFSSSVTGVDATDFALVQGGGVTGASITSVTGGGATWTVTANTGSGTGTLGLNLVDDDSIIDGGGNKLGGTGAGNGNFTGQVYTISTPLTCVTDNFSTGTLDPTLWSVKTILGPYLPQVINAGGGDYRLRLTDTQNNEATFAQLNRTFPAAGNKVVLEIDYFSYGGSNPGADGIAVTFSDATIASTTGGFGGSLGYAQNNTNPGFGGGWLGIGLDEYGNYPCNNESRTGYPAGWTDPVLGAGATVCTGSGGGNHYVAIRGSGSGTTGYNLLANTGIITATAPTLANSGAGATPYRYRFTLDHSDSVHAYVTVERDTTGTGTSYTTLVPKFDVKASSVQASVPANWLVSFTGSTGGSTNNHELKQVKVCANTIAGGGPDHLEIDHPSGTGLTCTPSTLTIKACTDAAVPCVTPYTGGVTGTLSATGTPTVNWSGGSGFTIPAGSSTVTKDVQVTTPGSVVFDATSTPTASSATTCNFGTPGCTFTAFDTGFLVSAPNHAAESSSTLTVQAVKKADNSLACVPAFASTSKTVNLKCAYSNPATGTLPVRVGGTALNATASTGSACDGTGANVVLSFDASGIATPALQYADVGQMNVSAAYTGTAGALDAGLSMIGTGSFIAAPASFGFSAITGGPIKAGNSFSATVSALNNSGAVTPNFGKETTAEGVTLTSNLVNPVGGTNPTPGNNIIPGNEFGAGGMVNDANGVATVNNLSWGEVGSITLTAGLTSASYLGSGLNPTGTSATVGAFIPDHFDTAVIATATTPMSCPTGLTCPTLYNGFVYSGQPFSVQVTARNLAGGTTTNYHSAYGLSNNVTLSAWDALGSVVTQNPGSGALANTTLASTAFNSGVGLTNTQAYTFATSPTSPTDIFLRAVDAVNTSVTSRRATPATSVEGGVKVVSGKVKISNANGSELLPLPLTATVQYWNNTSWLASTTDSITQFNTNLSTAGGNIVSTIVNGLGSGVSVATPGMVTVAAGATTFTLNKPGVVGSTDISLNAPSYLLGSSNGAGVNPSKAGRATFGVYKGPNEFIYLRENY